VAHRRRQTFVGIVRLETLTQTLSDGPGPDVAFPDRGEQRVDVGVVERGHLGLDLRTLHDPVHRKPLATKFSGQLLAAGLDQVLTTLAREPLLDLVAGFRR
jgi:hypothetical protein